MLREPVATRDLEAAHEWRRRAQLRVDRPRDRVSGDEREVVGSNLDHETSITNPQITASDSWCQEIASDVSLVIHVRYLSSPALTGIASSSGTLYG